MFGLDMELAEEKLSEGTIPLQGEWFITVIKQGIYPFPDPDFFLINGQFYLELECFG